MQWTQSTLKNHLRLFTVPMSGVDSITILILIGAGSRYERPREAGISHFAEHMFFKGTTKRPHAQDIAAEIDGVGGVINAFTGEEYTGFYVKIPRREFPRGLDVLSDMLQNATFAPEEITRECGVIIEEINMIEDQPQRKVFDVFKHALYGNSALGRPIAGTKDVVTKLTQRDFTHYRESLYTPNNIVVTLAGNLSQNAHAEVERFLGDWAGHHSERFTTAENTQHKPTIRVLHRKSEQAHLVLGVRAVKRDHPLRYALILLNAILGANMSSRLFIEVRERRGLAYAIHSSLEPFRDVGAWLVYAGVDLNKVDKCATVILSELRRIRDEEVSEEELRRAKAFVKGRTVLQMEDTEEVASFFGMQGLLEKKVLEPAEVFKKIDAVSIADVQHATQKIMQRKGLNLAVVGEVSASQEKKLHHLSL